MAINFPASPTLNQTFSSGNVNYSTWYGGWAGVRQHPAPGHSSLETMTQEEYRSEITLSERGKEVIRVDEEGFHYNGQFIADAGEAHRLLVEFLKKHTA
jgi:hypothetical protein